MGHSRPKAAKPVDDSFIGKKIRSTDYKRNTRFILISIHDGLCECDHLVSGARYTFKIDTCYFTKNGRRYLG